MRLLGRKGWSLLQLAYTVAVEAANDGACTLSARRRDVRVEFGEIQAACVVKTQAGA